MKNILKYIPITRFSTLFLCWLVTCFVPDIDHPLLNICGEKGSGKSTVNEILKSLIDPSILDTLKLPNDQRSLVVSLQQHWFAPFDNVSRISNDTSDDLCRAITGSGIQQRTLYTNAKAKNFKFNRVISINGIFNSVTRSDLLDRTILVEVSRISKSDRRTKSEIKADFAQNKTEMLGGIFDTLAKAMAIYPTVKLDGLPRMADFTKWGYAIGEALGGKGNQFLSEYEENCLLQNDHAINEDTVAALMVELMSGCSGWEGKVSELYTELKNTAIKHGFNTNAKDFPQHNNRLTQHLDSIRSNLEDAGITYENLGHGRTGTTLIIRKLL